MQIFVFPWKRVVYLISEWQHPFENRIKIIGQHIFNAFLELHRGGRRNSAAGNTDAKMLGGNDRRKNDVAKFRHIHRINRDLPFFAFGINRGSCLFVLCDYDKSRCYVPVSYTHLDVYKRQVSRLAHSED